MAIAFDAQSGSAPSGASTTLTWSHTCSGSDRLLVVGVYCATDTITGVTYNSVAMTQINKYAMTGAATGQFIYLYYLVNPSTGANNVVATSSGTANKYGGGTSFTGVKQTNQPDASNTNGSASATSLTTSVTTIANNCWIVGWAYSGTAVTAGTNTIVRSGATDFAGLRMIDTNSAQTPAGSHSVQTTEASATFLGHVVASFSPAVTTNTSLGFFMMS